VEFSIKSGSPEKQRSACVVVGIFEPRKLTLAAELLDNAAHNHLSDIIRRGDMEGKAGSTLLLHNVPGTLVRPGPAGRSRQGKGIRRQGVLRRDSQRRADAQRNRFAFDGTVFLTETSVRKRSSAWRVRQAAIVAQETVYRFDQFKSKKDKVRRPLRKLTFVVDRRNELAIAEEALNQGQAIAEGMSLAKNLANLPGNVCTPAHFAETAQKMAAEHKLECQILEREEMAALGMHSLLAVAKARSKRPKLIVLQYKGGKNDDQPVVLSARESPSIVAEFRSSRQPEMDEMKYDMCGAASVLGTIKAAAMMKLPINLTVIVPTTENMPGGAATRPGDIVTSMSGQTIEILNTDAEGRLILCDALTYAARFEPDTVIDVATLTGACVIALGHIATGLFANNDTLARELLQAGEEAHDRAWQMPLWSDYQELLKSPFADMANIGGRWGGSITAACFLARFTRKYVWAHLDIAGTAWKSGTDKGATGRPVPLLMHYLLKRAGKLS
jgi:leucyl aminopeptidase